MRCAVLVLLLVALGSASAEAVTTKVKDGRVAFREDGRALFADGRLGFAFEGQWHDVVATRSVNSRGGVTDVVLATDSANISLRAFPVAAGALRVEVTGPRLAEAMRVSFARDPAERFMGFGERSDAVTREGGSVLSRVTEGPFQPEEGAFVAGAVPPAGQNPRADATYFPIPWLLSSRGPGFVLLDDGVSGFRLGSPWSLELFETNKMTFEVYAGPTPADALRRFTARVGRQPPAAAPFYFGPWWQPNGDPTDDLAILGAANALGSLVQTYTKYLPCGEQQSENERAATNAYHSVGLAVTTYVNPMVCTSYSGRYDAAAADGALTRRADSDPPGMPYTYDYSDAGQEYTVAQYDFTSQAGRNHYRSTLTDVVGDGYDGWMEDRGEYTPDDAFGADGSTGGAAHNRYPLLYHATSQGFAQDVGRPLARFSRSGWTGTAQFSPIVTGGEPSTSWGFDGLQSAVRNGLSMGLSGVSLWGSDIGGYYALSEPQTSAELLQRWIQFGFASGVMRTQATGYDLGNQGRRAQITDSAVLPVWVRYSRLRTLFYPYIAAAQRIYNRTGLPIMRHLALHHPDDPIAATLEDQYMFGPDILVAPVLQPGATTRTVYLPRGRWVDFWRSVTLREDGTPQLREPVIYAGGQYVEGPVDELPMFVRSAAALTLLPGDVQTLSPYGEGTAIRLADRDHRRTLIAWARTARVKQNRRRRVDVQMAFESRICRRSVRIKSGTIRACRRVRRRR